MTKRTVRLPGNERPLLDIFSAARGGPYVPGHFNREQIAQIARTVRRIPEVMVKVTGGGGSAGSVSAHFSYISREGELEIETDDGQRIGKDEHKAVLDTWHLGLTAGQYRQPREERTVVRKVKLTHNIVLSMPSPTPPDKVLAAARTFARDKFAGQHRYAMVLHTDQQHPHVHLVVKAESDDGRRLRIDKALLREWREDFARMMREQGVAANATPRAVRGRNKGKNADGIFRARRRGSSTVLRARVTEIAKELSQTGAIRDPARGKLIETRKTIFASWMQTADALDAQGEVVLAADVRYFARHLPPVLTDKERLAGEFLRHRQSSRVAQRASDRPTRDRRDDFSR